MSNQTDKQIVYKLVTLKFTEGSFEQGFSVTLQISTFGSQPLTELNGKLPANPELLQDYQQWRSAYLGLWQPSRISVEPGQITNISTLDACHDAAEQLRWRLNQWLQAEAFRAIREKWLEKLMPDELVCALIQTKDLRLQRLPWHLWDVIERYPNTEIALSLPSYEQNQSKSRPDSVIRILAILGSSKGIDVEADRSLLSSLPNAEVTILVEPSRQQFNDRLWQQNWNILFFAGHSSTQANSTTGKIELNSTEHLTISQLRYAMQKAVSNGLELAIFNSCDGLGLAQELSELNISNLIVMREPIPDRVAQTFLKYFLSVFAAGELLYISVRHAREGLQGLESQFPCATWLPVIFQNPTHAPLTWYSLSGVDRVPERRVSSQLSRNITKTATILLKSIAVTVFVGGIRFAGWLQPIELQTLDLMQRLRSEERRDSRIVVVTIDDNDIKMQPAGRGSLSDSSLKQLLDKLKPFQPSAIGLDLYRDFAVESKFPQLKKQLQITETLIATCKTSDPENKSQGVAAPPEIPLDRVGFSDFLEDSDGVLRRQILFMTPDPASICIAPYALSTQLAFRYLADRGINPKFTSKQDLQLGSVVFQRLRSRFGGYQTIDARGSQILLNYRLTRRIATQVSLTDVLEGRFDLNAVRNRVVLIGVTAQGAGDQWATPYGRSSFDKLPGVLVQAQMTSQIISAVVDRRELLWALPFWGDVFWILVDAFFISLIGWQLRYQWQIGLLIGFWSIGLYGICFVFLLQGGWMPCVPTISAAIISGLLSIEPVDRRSK